MMETEKPLAVIDKSPMQGIAGLPNDQPKRCLEALRARYAVVVAFELIEEVLARYVSSAGEVRQTHRRILSVIDDLFPNWLDHPLELVFKQLVLKQTTLDPWLGGEKLQALRSVLADLDTGAPDLERWAEERRLEKVERVPWRKRQQEICKKAFSKGFLNPPDLATFMENGIRFLCHEMELAELKMLSLNAYLGSALKRWHPDSAEEIENAFSEVTFDSLDRARFTRNYLLAEVLYDLAPIIKWGPRESEKSNPLVLSGKQINSEEDQQYIACAFACQRLLTCDGGMHRIASLFTARGLWLGEAISIPRARIDQIETFLQ